MYLRAAAAAALALIISGDTVRLGWDAVRLWHYFFPYFWLFLLLECGRARRRIEDGEVFLAGAAMAMLYGGVYAKDLQYGQHPFGIDWLTVPCAVFDGGLTAVLSLHLVERLNPRLAGETEEASIGAIILLAFGLGAAATVYGIKTAFNFYRAERMLGPMWLIADIAFAYGAWKIAQLAWRRSHEDAETGRENWVWALAAFAVWLPGARIVARFGYALELPAVLVYFFVAAWTAVAAGLAWRLWKERHHFGTTPLIDSKPAAASAIWRVAGSIILIIWLGADLNDGRSAGLFSAAIDWPSRALFALAFLSSRLKV